MKKNFLLSNVLALIAYLLIVLIKPTPLYGTGIDQVSTISTTATSQLVVVLMVRNEAQSMRKTLQPYISAGIKDIFVYEGGLSDDDTIAVTKALFEEWGIKNGVIKQETWVDFATCRNHALKLAHEAFPQAKFILFPDADWYIHNVEGLLTFCADHCNDTEDSYFVRIMNQYCDFVTPRLIRCGSKAHFVGAAHEVIHPITTKKVTPDVYFEWGWSKQGLEQSQRRWTRDYEVLLREFQKNPHDPRTVFYLGQTKACLGHWKEACQWYELRITMNGWAEENFMTHYKLAQAYQASGNWDKAQHYYLKAYSLRPHRIEPLIQLAQHYWDNRDTALSYLFARRAVDVDYPESDMLFVEKDTYDYVRYNLLSLSAWYQGDYNAGRKALEKALLAHPEEPHLIRNLKFYDSKQA